MVGRGLGAFRRKTIEPGSMNEPGMVWLDRGGSGGSNPGIESGLIQSDISRDVSELNLSLILFLIPSLDGGKLEE